MGKYLSIFIDNQSIIKFYKYISIVFVLIMSVTIFMSCGEGSHSDGQDDNAADTGISSDGAPTNVVLYDPKSLFISDTSSSQVAAAYQLNSIEPLQVASDLIAGENILCQITQDGEIFEVIFLDESGNELEVMTTYIEQLNASYIYIEFEVVENVDLSDAPPPPSGIPYCALINLGSGKIYDLAEFFIVGLGGVPATGSGILGITNNLLFLISDFTLYNIDLSTMVATAMNNPEYDPVDIGLYWTDSFIYYNETLNRSYVAFYKTYPIDASIKVYCTDNSLPVETLFEEDSYLGWVAGNHKIYSDGKVYFVNGDFPASEEKEITGYLSSSGGSLDSIKIYQISIDDTKIPTIELISTTDLQSEPPLCSDGIIDAEYYTQIDSSTTCLFSKSGKISIVSNNGSVTAQFESIDFSEISSGVYNEDYIYYGLDDSIKRASISDGTKDTILTDSYLIDWYIAGDFIFYTKYITATQVNTYKILKDGTGTPELVSSSDMEIIQVLELVL